MPTTSPSTHPDPTTSSATRTHLGAAVLLALLLVATALATVTTSPAAAITGGRDAPAPYSFMGSLQLLDGPRDDGHVCGVSLIAPQWAITAGHCTRTAADVIDEPTTGSPRHWQVRFGSTQVGTGGDLVDVERFVQLNNRYFVDDLALLRLARPVQGTPIAMTTTTPAVGTPTRILGWGQTCHDPVAERCSPTHLQEAGVSIQGRRACHALDHTFCVGRADGEVQPENMDSGGPALVLVDGRWTLAGTTEGGGLGDDPASLYTDTSAYQDWIQGLVSGAVPIPADTPFRSNALRGTALVGGCSAAVFRSPQSRRSDPAMVLTNGHCVDPRPEPGGGLRGRADDQRVLVKDRHGDTVVRAHTTRLLHATMTGTDVAVYRLDTSYADLRARKVPVFALAPHGPRVGQRVRVLSAGSAEDYTCTVAAIVPGLVEAGYTQHGAIRYQRQRGCAGSAVGDGKGPGHGDSGSPLVDPRSGRIVGIHGTGNDEGLRCLEDNPCEVDARGRRTSVMNARYGQQTALLRACLAPGSRMALSRPACTLA